MSENQLCCCLMKGNEASTARVSRKGEREKVQQDKIFENHQPSCDDEKVIMYDADRMKNDYA